MSGTPSQQDSSTSAEQWAALDSKYERLADASERLLLRVDRARDPGARQDHDPPLLAAS